MLGYHTDLTCIRYDHRGTIDAQQTAGSGVRTPDMNRVVAATPVTAHTCCSLALSKSEHKGVSSLFRTIRRTIRQQVDMFRNLGCRTVSTTASFTIELWFERKVRSATSVVIPSWMSLRREQEL